MSINMIKRRWKDKKQKIKNTEGTITLINIENKKTKEAQLC